MATKTFEFPSETINEAVPSVGDLAARVQQGASALGEKAAELGHGAVDAMDARRGTAATGIDSAATALHRNADKLPASASRFAHQAAHTLEATAGYVRDHTMQDVAADLEGYVKAHPTQAFVGAAVVGFLAGRMLSRK